MRHHPELDLGIIRNEKHPSRSWYEAGPNRLTTSGPDRDVLEIRLRRAEPPSGGTRLVEAGVNPAGVPIDSLRQCVDVGALELLQLAILQDQSRQFVSHGGQLLQHVGIGRWTSLGLLQHRQLMFLE